MPLDISLSDDRTFLYMPPNDVEVGLAEITRKAVDDPDLPAYLAMFATEACGEFLPWFYEEAQTAFGFMHQGTFATISTPKLFAQKSPRQRILQMQKRLLVDRAYRGSAFATYDTTVRPVSLVADVDLVDLLYNGKDQTPIDTLNNLRRDFEAEGRKVHERIAMGLIYIVSRSKDPALFFAPLQRQAGVDKRNEQAPYIGLGHEIQQRVFRGLCDYGGFFDAMYQELCKVAPEVASKPSILM